MAINIGEDSLNVECTDQPFDGRKIWPSSTKWFYIPNNETRNGDFMRNDSISLSVYLNEDKLHINFQPPREWSYKEECPNDNSGLICSEEGQ